MLIERLVVRSTKIHPQGNTTARDTDIMDRDAWRRLYRSCRDVLMSGGEVHIRPVVEGDGIPVSMPNPLKGRVEELEAGIREAIKEIQQIGRGSPVGLHVDWAIGSMESLLPEFRMARTPASIARACGMENEVEDAQSKGAS